MVRIVRSGKRLDVEDQINQLLESDEQDEQISSWVSVLKKHCVQNGESPLVTDYLKHLREEHDWGHPKAHQWAFELACAADLPARAIDWLFSAPRDFAGGKRRSYRKNRKQRLRDMLVYYQVQEIIDEERATSVEKACVILASELGKKGVDPGSGLEKAYNRHLKSIRKLL